MVKCKCIKEFDVISSEGNYTVKVGDKVECLGGLSSGLTNYMKCVWNKIRFDLESTFFYSVIEKVI